MSDIVQRLRNPPFGTETSERNLMTAAADVIERLRSYCSAAANDYDGILTSLEGAAGFSLADKFRSTAKELRETSEFMRLAAEGRDNGLLYDDELSKAKAEIERLKSHTAVT